MKRLQDCGSQSGEVKGAVLGLVQLIARCLERVYSCQTGAVALTNRKHGVIIVCHAGSVVIKSCGELSGKADEQHSRERFRRSRSRTRSASRRRKQRKCYI